MKNISGLISRKSCIIFEHFILQSESTKLFLSLAAEKSLKINIVEFLRENIIKLFQDNLAIELWDGQSDSNFNVTVTNTVLDGWEQYPYLFQLDV